MMRIISLTLFLFTFMFPPTLWGQSQLIDIFRPKQTENQADKTINAAEKKKEVEAEILQLEKSWEQANAIAPDSPRTKHLKDQLEGLEELKLYYEQIAEAQKQFEERQARIQGEKEELRLWSQSEPPQILNPSFSNLDKLEGQLNDIFNRKEIFESSLKTLHTTLAEQKESFQQLETERRRAKEALETNRDPTLQADLTQTLENLQLESRNTKAKMALTSWEIKNEKILQEIAQAQERVLSKKIEWLKGNVQFTNQDLEEKIDQIEETKQDLTREIRKTRNLLQRLEASAQKDEAEWTDEQREKYQNRKNALQTRINLLSRQFQRLDEIKDTWRRRYLAFNDSVDKSQLLDWEKETRDSLEDVRRQENIINVRLGELKKEADNGELTDSYSLIQTAQNYLGHLNQEHQLYEKFLIELQPKVTKLELSEKLGEAWTKVVKVWRFELFSVDDRPITVQKLFFALILLILGYKFSRKFSRWLGSHVFPHLGLESGVAAALKTLAFYLLITFVTLTVLYLVNVPLTLFTVLGGALAIGVGFGSQNIVRNFISSLILLIERPIKVGDMVELDGTYGTIESIGARSTIIRGFNNVHAIVPNSDLLEKKVVNWTLSDDLIRIMVSVGVAYGSPTRDVAKLIRKAVTEHGKVIPNPEPIILFKEFGNSSLDFEVHFWIKMRVLMDRERIESDIRYRIDSLFREAGITIAFPQRDVHLDALGPLPVKVIPPEEKSPIESV